MKRAIVVSLIVGLVASALFAAPAEAKKKKSKKTTRTAEADYVLPNGGLWLQAVNLGGASFPISMTESYVSVVVTDLVSPKVWGVIGQDTNGDLQADTSISFCGKTDAPVPVTPGIDVTVFLFQGPCLLNDSSPAFGTAGTIIATFSNLP